MALALDETEERSKSVAIVRFVCLSLAGGLNFMTSLARLAIRSVIIRVITKSDDRAAGVRFVYHEYD